jgi:hypothetical protein
MPALVPPLPAGHARPGSGSPAGPPPGSCWPSWRRTCPPARAFWNSVLGAGVGTAWIAGGLLPGADVTVTTIEKDPRTAALAARGAWPQFVDREWATRLTWLPGPGPSI